MVGAAALALPVAADQDHPGVLGALFLATSAVTVTGLITFDIDGLSLFGEVVVLALIQIGGFGLVTIGIVLGVVTARRLGVRQRVLARTEIGSIDLGEVRSLVVAILRITVLIGSVAALLLGLALGSLTVALSRPGSTRGRSWRSRRSTAPDVLRDGRLHQELGRFAHVRNPNRRSSSAI